MCYDMIVKSEEQKYRSSARPVKNLIITTTIRFLRKKHDQQSLIVKKWGWKWLKVLYKVYEYLFFCSNLKCSLECMSAMFKCTIEYKQFFFLVKMTCHFYSIFVAKSLHTKTVSHSCHSHNLFQWNLYPTSQILVNPGELYPLINSS